MASGVVFHYNLLPIRLMSALTTGWALGKPDRLDALHLRTLLLQLVRAEWQPSCDKGRRAALGQG